VFGCGLFLKLRWHVRVLVVSHLKHITERTTAYVLDDFVSIVEQSSGRGGHFRVEKKIEISFLNLFVVFILVEKFYFNFKSF
jgi:hypothetical protein